MVIEHSIIMNKILITGAAGFIGFHLCLKMSKHNIKVIGLDNLNDYYDIDLKIDRLKQLGISNIPKDYTEEYKSDKLKNFSFIKSDINNVNELKNIFKRYKFDLVCNLAAQAGVRYSLVNPKLYIDSNICGFFNVLETCKNFNVKNIIFASSSSVYGESKAQSFDEKQKVDKPASLYAATKKSNELLAHCYSEIYNMKIIGLRFFTVYGPWGRPDMAPHLFVNSITKGESINVYNMGNSLRDFTYIDDIISGINLIINDGFFNGRIKKNYDIYNIGNGEPILIKNFISILEKKLKRKAKQKLMKKQPGDVHKTASNIEKIQSEFNYKPKTDLESGTDKFVNWFLDYY